MKTKKSKGIYRLKLEFRGIPVVTDDSIPKGEIWFYNPKNVYTVYPRRKDGKIDMRYSVNKLYRLLNPKRGEPK